MNKNEQDKLRRHLNAPHYNRPAEELKISHVAPTPSVAQLRETDQQLICKALICLRDSILTALREVYPDDDDSIQEFELDLEQCEAMYGAITGEEMPVQ